jgi:dienelactone hydrolase
MGAFSARDAASPLFWFNGSCRMNLMRRSLLALLVLLVATGASAESVLLRAADGVQVHGDVWRAAGAKPPIVVAFHQASSSAAEYAPIAPRLVGAGFTVLAIDQRSGDGAFGGSNRTAAALGHEAGYDEALPDLEAALAWAKGEAHGAPVVVWGSSYSAALVFLLAAAHPGDVAAIVAFSPGEYLARKDAVGEAARKVTVPVYIDQASSAEEVANSAAILKAVRSADKQQFVRAPSTHGSSTLRTDRNAAGAEAHWQGVLRFLARFTPRP